VGPIRQTVYRGLRRVDQHFKLTMVASAMSHAQAICFLKPLLKEHSCFTKLLVNQAKRNMLIFKPAAMPTLLACMIMNEL
jgi:hypothetical protein